MTAYSSVIGLSCDEHLLQRLGVRAVREAGGVERHHAGLDVVAAEEVAGVVEQHFVEIVVVVEERHFQRAGIGLERARAEGADDEAIRQEGRVDAGRQVVAVADATGRRSRTLMLHRREIAVPADGVHAGFADR